MRASWIAPLAVALSAALLVLAGGVGASDLSGFARCLDKAGATYYFAAWCPHCARQNAMFGDALDYVPAVDCTDGCDGVQSFPTWRFADGSLHAGVASLDVLARRTGCRLGAEAKGTPQDTGWTRSESGRGARERYEGGAKIVEIPGR